jgi:hypothetical protein
MIQHSSGEEESRISYNENSVSLEQDEEIHCKTAKPTNGQYETWHIKKPLMDRRKDATQATMDSFYAKKGHRFETETEVASASHTPRPP